MNIDIERPQYKDGEPCKHIGCLNHVSHPCEGCGRIAGRSKPKPEERSDEQIPAVRRSQAFCIFNDDDGSLVLIFDNFDDAKHYVDTWNEKNQFVRYYLEIKDIVNGSYKYEPVKDADGVVFMYTMCKDNA